MTTGISFRRQAIPDLPDEIETVRMLRRSIPDEAVRTAAISGSRPDANHNH
jgi:hypothetical protein